MLGVGLRNDPTRLAPFTIYADRANVSALATLP